MWKIPKKKSRPGIDEYGRNDFHYAALENKVRHLHRLINKGVDINALDDNGFSAFKMKLETLNC